MKKGETKDRIKEAMELREIKQAELVEKTGIDKGQMSSYLSGKYKPKQRNINLLAQALSVDEAWLMGYDVPMERNGSKIVNIDKAQDIFQYYNQLNDIGKHVATERVKELTEIPRYGKKDTYTINTTYAYQNSNPTRLINYYYRLASAGTGQIIFDMPPTKRIEIPNIPEYRKVDYAIGVNGNSMEPTFYDGDMLLIEMTEEIDPGEIGIFLVDNESYVKKLGKGELISLNPECDNIPLTENSRCMGRVIDKLEFTTKQ